MNRYHRDGTELLSEYLDGALSESERADVEAHLAECGACRDLLAELRDVVLRARELSDVQPPRDLWPGVASGIGGPARALTRADAPDVLVLPSARGAGAASSPPGKGVQLRRGPLAAAAAALVAISVSATWWVASARTAVTGPLETASTASPAEPVVSATAVGTPPADMASELETLEEVLDVARDALDPNTVRVLERNLGVIERAIADSRQALELDPGNAFLTEHLERMYRRKLTYLQDAVRVVQWES